MVRAESEFDEILNVNICQSCDAKILKWHPSQDSSQRTDISCAFDAKTCEPLSALKLFFTLAVPRTGYTLNPPLGCGSKILISILERETTTHIFSSSLIAPPFLANVGKTEINQPCFDSVYP